MRVRNELYGFCTNFNIFSSNTEPTKSFYEHMNSLDECDYPDTEHGLAVNADNDNVHLRFCSRSDIVTAEHAKHMLVGQNREG